MSQPLMEQLCSLETLQIAVDWLQRVNNSKI